MRSTFAYDALGELAGYCSAAQVDIGSCDPATDSNVQAWHWTYDAGGHQASEVPPANTAVAALDTSTSTYDAGGRLVTSTDSGWWDQRGVAVESPMTLAASTIRTS